MSLALRRAVRPNTKSIRNAKELRKEKRGRMSNTLLSSAPALARQAMLAGTRHRNQVYSRFSPVSTALANREPRRAAAIAHQILTQSGRVPDDIRPDFYILAVKKFLRARDWERACQFYNRMKAQGLPGQAEVIKLLLQASQKLPSMTSKLDHVIREAPKTLDRIGEEEIIAILMHLVRGKTNIYAIREFFKNTEQRMGDKRKLHWEIYALMVQAEAQNGYELAAMEWFTKAKRRIGEMEQAHVDHSVLHDARQRLYTRLIIGSAAFNENRPNLFNQILIQMKRDQVQPNRRISNFYIHRYALKGRPDRAYTFYRAMRYSNPPIPADHHTFYSLFTTIKPSHPISSMPTPSGRRIFRDMTRQHLSNTDHRPQTQSNVLSTAVLNAALRYFMRRQDYAAATVTMRTFPVCCIPPNINTHNTVVDTLVTRIQEELMQNPGKKMVLWSDRLLGEAVRLLNGAWVSDIARMLHETVERGARSARYNGVDIAFLLRLLHRAMLAALNRWPGKEPEVDRYVVGRVMNSANAAMLPPKKENTTGWFMASPILPQL